VVQTFWVHDFQTEDWIRAESATYVLGEDLYTPMAFGVVAFAERSAADQFAGEAQGVVLDFIEVMEHFSLGHQTGGHNYPDHMNEPGHAEGMEHHHSEDGVESPSAGD
jgi:copper chaperone NosL